MSKMRAVDFTKVKINDSFWAPRIETNRNVTIGIQYAQLKETGRLASLDPDYKPGDRNAHHIFWDSDIAKWIETAAYSLAAYPDTELEQMVDEVVGKYERLQWSDGYLNSWFSSVEPDKRWTNLRDNHELYCAGHLIEAAVAYYLATGKDKLLKVMCRYVDHIDSVFGTEDGKRPGYCGHEEIELALIKLYSVTKDSKHLKLAKYFIDQRGNKPHYFDTEAFERGESPRSFHFRNYEYNQSHIPVREQTRVVGHAVRAMYLYCGMADIAREANDDTLIAASDNLWDNVCRKQMYIIGGIGPSASNEGFTFDYDMPEESAYCETCAAIGLAFWNHRLLQLKGDSKYADVMERALYNGTISGVSLSGDRFFYVNPLASLGTHHRQEWFGCACCPPNISRLIASIGQYIYSESDDTAWIHLYTQSSGELRIGDRSITLEQMTGYPWDGTGEILVDPDIAGIFTLALRIPGWCRNAQLSVNGEIVELHQIVENGYAKISRMWAKGDIVTFRFDMPVEMVSANPAVRQANGKIALQRGPIVYCLEENDNPVSPLSRIQLSESTRFDAEYKPGFLGGVVVLSAEAEVLDDAQWSEGELYKNDPPHCRRATIAAVPYCVWDNREPGNMLVWLRRK